MSDPNFPPNLNIKPLGSSNVTDDQQRDAIVTYGIAGRVCPSNKFDPPCSLLSNGEKKVIELGSGQSVASLHLAKQLQRDDLVVLTDLPEVVPLCEQAIQRNDSTAQVIAQPLAWGEDAAHLRQFGPFTHVLMCDLIYFPHLYPLLLHTLLCLTEPVTEIQGETFGPEVILSYTSRTLSLEESFFDALALYFHTTPVRGGDWEAKVFICRRWKVTDEWTLPGVKDVMNGGSGVLRGRSFGLVDDLFGSLEWDI